MFESHSAVTQRDTVARALPLVGLGTGLGVDAGEAPEPVDHSIADAGRAALEGMTEEERNRSFTDLETDDDDGDGDGADPARRPAAPADDDSPYADGEPILRETDGAEWNGESQRWMLNGKFVEGAAPEGWTKPAAAAPAKPVAKAAVAKAGDPDPDAATKPVKVTLPGIADRGEEDIEVEVDAELAQRIQRLKNDGMRAKQYTARQAELDAREAQMDAYAQELEVDPIGFHINKMPAAQQLEVARALLIDHLEALAPDIERLSDPNERMKALRDLGGKVKQSSDRLTKQRAVALEVKSILRAVDVIVPEGTDEATASLFIADARRDLAAAADRGEPVTSETVKRLLARRITLYGFDKPTPRPAAKPAAPLAARPVTDRARDIAARRPLAADATAAQTRVRRTQTARSAAQRIAPAGAGAAPTQAPALPDDAHADIATLTKALRGRGLPQSWQERGE